MDELHRPKLDTRRGGVETLQIPEIYDMISRGSSDIDIAIHIFREYQSKDGVQIAILGLLELQRRLPQSLEILKQCAGDSSSGIGETARYILNKPNATWLEVEKILNKKERGSYILQTPESFEQSEWESLYKSALERDIIDSTECPNIEEFIELAKYVRFTLGEGRPPYTNAHLDGFIDDELLTTYHTFGVHDPAHIELLGPLEILRLRKKREPHMVLLGSLGNYSAREFAGFSKKINLRSTPTVVDITKECVDIIQKFSGENDLRVRQGDALHLDSFDAPPDTIYTDHLFHFLLRSKKKGDSTRDVLRRFFTSVGTVLDKDGSLVIVEQPFGFEDIGGSAQFRSHILSVADQCGFSPTGHINTGPYRIFFRPDVANPMDNTTGVQIDTYGFGQYGNIAIGQNEKNCMYARFIRKNTAK